MCIKLFSFCDEEENRKIEIEGILIRGISYSCLFLSEKLSYSPTMDAQNCVDFLNRRSRAIFENIMYERRLRSRNLSDRGLLGIIGLRDNFKSRVRRYIVCYLYRPSLGAERVQGVISFGTIKGPTTLNPGGHPRPAEKSRNTIPA